MEHTLPLRVGVIDHAYRRENWGLERKRDKPKVTLTVCDRGTTSPPGPSAFFPKFPTPSRDWESYPLIGPVQEVEKILKICKAGNSIEKSSCGWGRRGIPGGRSHLYKGWKSGNNGQIYSSLYSLTPSLFFVSFLVQRETANPA